MRKWIGVLIILVLIAALIYLFIPGPAGIQQKLVIAANKTAFAREFLNEKTWEQWWPEKKTVSQHLRGSFKFNGNTYTLVEKTLSSVAIAITNGKDSVLTELIFIPDQNDSLQLSWHGTQKSTSIFLRRIRNSSWIKNINSDIHFLLQKMGSFYSDEDKIYGLYIQKDNVIDSSLISTSAQTRAYPNTELIYKMIDRLKDYVRKNAAKQTNAPMLNITESNGTFFTRVAIPVDKKLPDSGDIHYRWMLGGGNILVTEVKGGPTQIQNSFNKMENYIQDHQRVAPAIPFQSLLTDRRLEPDTNRWLTKLYWPVM